MEVGGPTDSRPFSEKGRLLRPTEIERWKYTDPVPVAKSTALLTVRAESQQEEEEAMHEPHTTPGEQTPAFSSALFTQRSEETPKG